jgi:hypothetical protein
MSPQRTTGPDVDRGQVFFEFGMVAIRAADRMSAHTMPSKAPSSLTPHFTAEREF